MRNASPHRELASSHRYLASPHQDFSVPLTRIQRTTLKESFWTLRRKTKYQIAAVIFFSDLFSNSVAKFPTNCGEDFCLVFTLIRGQNPFQRG